MTDRELTQLQETGSVMLWRAPHETPVTLASIMEGITTLGIDPVDVGVSSTAGSIFVRVVSV